MAVCPVSRVTPNFPGPKQAGPGAERFRRPGEPSVDNWIDLCIGCHLCDGVCPSGVNISELNLLARAKYFEEKGRPFRDWLLTHTHLFGKVGTLFPRAVNHLLQNRTTRWFLDAFFKIDRRREIPGYQFPTFKQWFEGSAKGGTGLTGHVPAESDKKVAYFYGCYANTNEVDVAKATVQVLEAIGFQVTLPHQVCCGIPMLGNGDFKSAKKMGLSNVPSLLRAARSGLEIVFSSTSCGHMIRHEYCHLLKIPGSEEVAEHMFDIFEFLRNLKGGRNLNIGFKELPLKTAYFSPCHLKSLGIGFPAFEILQLVPGLQIDYLDVDCCGLGGTFGFKKEKYDISEEIGKDLAEAIDRLKPEVVLSDCEGCRLQIRHLTGLEVLHPIQVLRNALADLSPLSPLSR